LLVGLKKSERWVRITHHGSQIVRHARFLAVDDTLFDRCSRRHCSDVPLEDR